MSPTKRKLLADFHSKRYFLVPGDRKFAPGEFKVNSLYGPQHSVHEKDIAEFEVSQDAARKWLFEQLSAWFSNARRAGIDYLDRLREWAAAEEAARSNPPPAPDMKHPFFDALRNIFAAGKAPTSEDAERADAWARAVKATAQRKGENPPENLEEFANPLQQLREQLNQEPERDASAATLKELAERVEATAALAAERLRELARDLVGEEASPSNPAEAAPAPPPVEVMPTDLLDAPAPPTPAPPVEAMPTELTKELATPPVEAMPMEPVIQNTAVVIGTTIIAPASIPTPVQPLKPPGKTVKAPIEIPVEIAEVAEVETPIEVDGSPEPVVKPRKPPRETRRTEALDAPLRPDPVQVEEARASRPRHWLWITLILILFLIVLLAAGIFALPWAMQFLGR